jgi:aspartyl-tRNA(Asn)/glutamyl-tRNA(Gln) amidotransferase subunit B
MVANWILGEVMRRVNEAGLSISQIPIEPASLVELLVLVDHGKVSNQNAKEVLGEMFETGKMPSKIVEERGLSPISEQSGIEAIVTRVIEENPKASEDYKKGKKESLGFLIGQVMRLTQGRANPEAVRKFLEKSLE